MSNKNLLNSVKISTPKRNVFNLSHDVKLSMDMGYLVPTLALECVPGDKFNISCESMVRLAPMIAPIMHRVDVTMHYFFVPNRILWPNWEKFITNTPDEVTGILPALPTLSLNPGSPSDFVRLADYFGCCPPPTSGPNDADISAFPFAAYQKIYDEYYRDQNLIPSTYRDLLDGQSNMAYLSDFTTFRRRSWEHDYFTACLPFAQKGQSVEMPLGLVELADDWANESVPHFQDVSGDMSSGAVTQTGGIFVGINDEHEAYDPDGSLIVKSTTINELRTAIKLQEWLEKFARGGSRYIEMIKVFFGVNSSDKRLQRPEYITGSKSTITISEVLNTTGTDDAPQGQMAGHGIGYNSGYQGSYYCEEHGYIIGIMNVQPKTAYQQGIPRHFLKKSPFDYYWEQFAHLGEQEVQQQELFAYTANKEDVFGYLPRYTEYKYQENRVAGAFRTSLNFWHMGRIFDTEPSLNADFINSVPTKRIFAVEDPEEDSLYCHVFHNIRAVRPMPVYGTPTF